MGEALYQARLSLEAGEVPVGAVLVIEGGQMVAHAHNFPISLNDPTARARSWPCARLLESWGITGCPAPPSMLLWSRASCAPGP